MTDEYDTLYASGVVWDLDGTLLNSFRLQEETLTEVFEERHTPVPPHSVFVDNYHGRLRDSIQGICGAEGDLLEEIYEDFIWREERHYEHPGELYFDDAIGLMQRNHTAGLAQIIVSNRPHHNDSRLGSPRNLVKRSPLTGLVQAVVCGDDNEFSKPDARMLDATEQTLGLVRSSLVVIGDQYVDAELAYNLRAAAILVARNGALIPHLERLPDDWRTHVRIVSSLDEVSITLPSVT